MRWRKMSTAKGTIYVAHTDRNGCTARVGYASVFAGKWDWTVMSQSGVTKGSSKTAAAAKRTAAKVCKR